MDKTEKIKQFINNQAMQEAVYEKLLESFTKPRPDADVYEKASRFISIENLQDAWKVLNSYKVSVGDDKKPEIKYV